MENNNTKIFVNGMVSHDIPPTTPDYILGKLSIKPEDLIKFLEENKHYAINGYLNVTILRSKTTGKRYAELDLWQYNKHITGNEQKEINPPTYENTERRMPGVDTFEQIRPEDIPF